MKGLRRAGLAVAGLLLVTGCTFRAPQADAVRAGLAALMGGDDRALRFDPSLVWIYELNDLEGIFYPLLDGSEVVFESSTGARLRYDGADLISGTALPNAFRRFTVTKAGDGRRVHQVDGVGRFEMRCAAPYRPEAAILLTSCEYESPATGDVHVLEHRVFRGAAGDVRRIEFQLVPGAAPLVLERLEDRVDEQTLEQLRERIARGA